MPERKSASAIKLVIATPLYPPDIGGPATYTVQLERELPTLGIDVATVAFTASRRFPKGISHIHFAWRLWLASKTADVILAQDPISVGLPSRLVSYFCNCKFIIRMPGDYAWEQSVQRFNVNDSIDEFQSKQYGWRVEWLRSLQQWVSTHADMIVTPSDYFNQLVQGWGIPAAKVTTVYNGLTFQASVKEIVKPPHKMMLTAGRLVPWKGIAELIPLLISFPDWHLYVIGEGPEKDRIAAAALRAGVKERLHWLGKLPREEVIGWCHAANVFILNTSFESFSFQVVEAMEAGVPVITTNAGSLPEIISSGVEGVLCAPNDIDCLAAAISSVINNPELWKQRTQAARIKAREFRAESTAAKMAELIYQVV